METNLPAQKSRRTDNPELDCDTPQTPQAPDHDMKDTPQDLAPPTVDPANMTRAVSILKQYIAANRRVIKLMDDITPADEQSKLKQVEARATLVPFNNGVLVAMESFQRETGANLNLGTATAPPSSSIPPMTMTEPSETEWTTVPARRRTPKTNTTHPTPPATREPPVCPSYPRTNKPSSKTSKMHSRNYKT